MLHTHLVSSPLIPDRTALPEAAEYGQELLLDLHKLWLYPAGTPGLKAPDPQHSSLFEGRWIPTGTLVGFAQTLAGSLQNLPIPDV